MKIDRISFRLNDRNEKKASNRKTEENEQEMTKRLEDKVIRSLCSLQKRVGPPEYRKWRRIHGLQLPLHPQQVIGWFILLIVGGATFLVMIPALRPLLREGLFIVLGTLFGLHIFSHLTALLLDPADPELRALNANFTVPEFDRNKHAHVIENGRCHLCNIKTTSSKTKHCSVCNKCIDQFDHHCKWLNHCIGGRNYVPFLICVASAVAASLVVVGVSVLEIVYYHVDPNLLAVFPVQHNETAQELFLPDSVFLGIVIVLGLLAATTAGLLLHLCLFHCYISILGVSTYEYIRNYRQEPNDGLQRRLVFGNNCCDKRNEVMSNHIDQSQYSRIKYKNCCYHSWSRPPEVGEDDDEGCSRAKSCFSRTKYFLRSGGGRKKKPLKRQSTDPEFVDKIIKPFLITLNEEKELGALDESKEPDPCFYKVNEFKDGKKQKQNNLDEIKNEEQVNRRSLSYPNLRSLCPKIIARNTIQNNENSVRIKTNQIRPTSAAEDLVPYKDVRIGAEPCSIATIAASENILPALNQTVTKVQSSADLRRLENVLDLIDGTHSTYDVLPIAKSIYRTTIRKKVACTRPRSPLLSPIKESGLSNPGSPRLDLVCSPNHVFVRPPTPETTTIFLSNSSSLSSSSDDDCEEEGYGGSDDNNHTPSSHFKINRRYRSDEILETPQLPRKVYSGSKGEQIFVLKPSKKIKSNKWVHVEIRSDV